MFETAQEKLVSFAACYIYLEQPTRWRCSRYEKIDAIRPLRRDTQCRRIAPDAGIFFRDQERADALEIPATLYLANPPIAAVR